MTMWHYDAPTDGILHVTIERADKPVNAFSKQALDDLAKLVTHVRNDKAIDAVVFRSAKPGNFIAGADVEEMKDLPGADAAREISRYGQQVFADLEALDATTICLISGACLGGGLEFALACNYRLADDSSKTKIGLPEVMLGLIPGWGGTVRLPKTIGLVDALPMILSGQQLSGPRAKRKGVVHDCIPTEALPFAAEKIVKTIRDKGSASSLFRTYKKPVATRWINWASPLKSFAIGQAEKQTLKQTNGKYPAPVEAIKALRAGLESEQAGYAAENDAIAKLSQDPVTTELMRVFFLSEAAKKPPEWFTAEVDVDAVENAAVIGAGAMGAGIAQLLARRGIWTRLKDIKPEFVANGMKVVRDLVSKDLKRKKLTKTKATDILDHVSPTTDYNGLKRADVVIEAIVEDMDIKRTVFKDLADASNEKTVLATNTSSLLVKEIAEGVPHPERVVGLHFFNPPHKMPLVEIVKTDITSPEAIATAFAVVKKLGKTGVVVGDCAGFLVNRLLSPYMNEAGFLLTEVEDPMEIEKAAVDFGMPMGPLELTDLVGAHVAAHVAGNMHAAYGSRMEPAPLWAELRAAGGSKDDAKLITKSKQGKSLTAVATKVVERSRKPSVSRPTRDEIVQRLIYPVINEAAICLAEGVADKPEDIDLAMIFGTGFAPFRGGPMRYADSVGLQNIVSTLESLATEHPRLAPSDALRAAANRGSFLEPLNTPAHTAGAA